MLDEIAFLKFNREVYAALAPAWLKAAEVARKNGAPYGKTLLTTPNNLDCEEGAWCMEQLISPAVRFKEEFYDYV